jgi:hypothetical protein
MTKYQQEAEKIEEKIIKNIKVKLWNLSKKLKSHSDIGKKILQRL